MVAGNGSAMVYARPGEPRSDRWPVQRLRRADAFGVSQDMIAALKREPAVAFLAAESAEGGIWIGSRKGDAHLVQKDDVISYERTSGDPLLLGCNWSGSSREWLERTWNGPYPDAAFHVLDQFRTHRSGDLLVVAPEGYDYRGRFEVPEHRSGHGSMIRVHMQTPVWANQPVPECALRTVDLFPALLDWLGTDIPDAIDGVPAWLPGSARQSTSGQRRTMVTA